MVKGRVVQGLYWLGAIGLGAATITQMGQSLSVPSALLDRPSSISRPSLGSLNQPALPWRPEGAKTAPPWYGSSFPLEHFTAYTSAFGYRQHPMGGTRFHYGLDLAAPMGSYIRSWWNGKIMRVASDRACGTHLIIQSGDWVHIYCHMLGEIVVEAGGDRVMVDRPAALTIRQGQWIGAGQRIGRVGMTGAATGPHLHWALRYQGAWIDPAIVIKAMYDSQVGLPR